MISTAAAPITYVDGLRCAMASGRKSRNPATAKAMFHGHTAEFHPANSGERVTKIPRCTATAPHRVTLQVRGHRLVSANVISAAGRATATRGRAPGTWSDEAMNPAAPVRVDHPELNALFRPDH